MVSVIRFFDFSARQLRFALFLAGLALTLVAYLLVKSYAMPQTRALPMTVHDGGERHSFIGLFIVDPNDAPVDSLELLPGIGPVLADRIVTYRQKHRFHTEVDITRVKGIGPHLFEQLRPYLKVKQI